MLDQAFENLRKATESILHLQQEMFQKWVGLWPGAPAGSPSSAWGEQLHQLQRRWADSVNEMLQRQRESSEALFRAGLESLENAFQFGEVKSVEELRTKTVALWRKSFDSLRQSTETQVRDFQAALQKWTELLTKPK
jgi:hypothetical protein